jgi:hypothetical protein
VGPQGHAMTSLSTTSLTTDTPDLHVLALELFLRMVAAEPYREPKRLAEQAYTAARAFLETRQRQAG